MNLATPTLLAALALLGACSAKPVQPYSEPPLSVPTAQLRVITNGEVRGDAYAGCLGDSKRLAKACLLYTSDAADE